MVNTEKVKELAGFIWNIADKNSLENFQSFQMKQQENISLQEK